jgi:hypothetical protein
MSGLMTKMQSVLRRGLLAAVGALHGMATNTIKAHLNVLPLDLHLENLQHQSLLRLTALLAMHLLHAMVRNAYTNP